MQAILCQLLTIGQLRCWLKASKYMADGEVGGDEGLCLNDADFAPYNSGLGRNLR